MASPSIEQRALIGFAARLGTSVSHEDGVSNEEHLRPEAELLMSLLVSNPSCTALEGMSLNVVQPCFGEDAAPEMEQGPSDVLEPEKEKTCAFSFSCPSLSLDANPSPPSRARTSSDGSSSDESEGSIPSLVSPAPIITMGRPLVVEDRDALRLSCEAMARNILRTFQKAVEWRKQCWVDTLARPLVHEEQKLKEAGATEEDFRSLLETPAALVISILNQSTIDVLEARTSFRVLPQRWDKKEGRLVSYGESPSKRVKVNGDNASKYTTAHVLSFQAVLHLSSPAGYSEVTLEAPGIIEGSFIQICNGEPKLSGVSVEVDTRVLSAMIEKSSRIITRASAESLMHPKSEQKHQDERDSSSSSPLPGPSDCMVTPYQDSSSSSLEFATPTIITPCTRTFTDDLSDSDSEIGEHPCIPLPNDFDGNSHRRAILRMVSPQPGCNSSSDESVAFTRTPTKRGRPSLVSPPLSRHSDTTEYLSFHGKTGPSLPALLEVACAAMSAH